VASEINNGRCLIFEDELMVAVLTIKNNVSTGYLILLAIFIVITFNYAGRVMLSIADTDIVKEPQISAVSMGDIFPGFGWVCLLMASPDCGLFDKYSRKKVYACSLLLRSLLTFRQGLWICSHRTGLRRMSGANGDGLLSVYCQRHQAHGATEIING
jgi:hypothetical protein